MSVSAIPAYSVIRPGPQFSSGVVLTQGNLSAGKTQPTPQVFNSAPQVLSSSGQPTMSTAQFLQKRINPEEVVMQEERQGASEPTGMGEASSTEDKPHDVAIESPEDVVKDGVTTPLGTGAPITSPDDVARTQIEGAKETDPMNPNVTPDPNS